MRRFLSVWLPRWPIEQRYLRHRQHIQNLHAFTQFVDGQEAAPFALIKQSGNAIRVTAANRAAEKAGVHPGISLTDARALSPELQTENAVPEEEAETLTSLAFWCLRFSPMVTIHMPDSLALDITGCAHLFGGE
ncbi:MAG: hypothetical protein MI743_16920, partial [Sneathiellales bacterium]|nr:hypothetical protein [Sneathiellales bacterium]